MGLSGSSATQPPPDRVILAEVKDNLISSIFGFLVNRASKSMQDIAVRRAMLEFVNRGYFLPVAYQCNQVCVACRFPR